MEATKTPIHSKETFLYVTSRTLERASFFGLRVLLVLYMVMGVLKMEHVEALTIYGWIATSLVFSQIIGALLGDLLLGNKRTLILGGIIQALGAFCLCIPSTFGLYSGLFMVIFGGGLYSPNMISSFGKLYLSKTKSLDAGFALFYGASNLGAFLGPLTIGFIGEKYGWSLGFIVSGITMLLSILIILFVKNIEIEPTEKAKISINKRIIHISIAFVSVAIFWAIYQIGSFQIFDIQHHLSQIPQIGIPQNMWPFTNSMFSLPLCILMIFIWSYSYSTQFFKLMIGFISGAISFGILLLIPETVVEQHMYLYLISMLFFGISEIHLAPIVHSTLTKYANPKYLAILISLAFIPKMLLLLTVSLFNGTFYEKPTMALLIGVIAMCISSIGLFIYYQKTKEQPTILKEA